MIEADLELVLPARISLAHDTPIFVADLEWADALANQSKLGVVIDKPIGPGQTRFEDTTIYRSFKEVFVDGRDWSTTEFFAENIQKIDNGQILWGCRSKNDFLKRLNTTVRDLYYSILSSGYLSQSNIYSLKQQNNLQAITERFIGYQESVHQNHEIKIGFNEQGEVIFVDGRHRLAIAKLLGIQEIPVNVVFRHKNWADFHHHLFALAKGLSNSRLYHKLSHPDLTYLPYAHGDERLDIIDRALSIIQAPPASTKVLDIGANMGNLSILLAKRGYLCTAVENNYPYSQVISKIADAIHLNVNVVNKSIFDVSPVGYDIIFALNIFHHFTNDKDLYDKLIAFLGKLECKWLVLQPHNMYAGDSGFGKYKPLSPDAFAELVRDLGNFRKIQFLSSVRNDQRNVYLISR
ncbi:hypothetical protein [Azospirillum picis]|uniref:SAM-dependent methyltransferase n=1 Tax=Azospirillum picis TaxID=488438 RepID=A0ABU0MUZ5_9PROT|nr:hypothetical protein [Azospirillum picis]MBP2300899.1 SAM-dependent methyltransferase [Azospirillum picis]MDQ0537003.1 SAM-dependent methyltransferase [Azospirillum picis]